MGVFGGGFPDGRAPDAIWISVQRTLQLLLLESRRALWVSGRLYRKYPLPRVRYPPYTCIHAHTDTAVTRVTRREVPHTSLS